MHHSSSRVGASISRLATSKSHTTLQDKAAAKGIDAASSMHPLRPRTAANVSPITDSIITATIEDDESGLTDLQKKRLIEACMRVSFTSRDYSYLGLPIKPTLGFFAHLARRPEGSRALQESSVGRLALNIPDTVIIGDGDPYLLYTAANGYVYRTESFQDHDIANRIGTPDRPTDVVAVLKKPDYRDPLKANTTNLLDSRELVSTLTNPPAGTFAIQRFVKPKGRNAYITRAVWHAHSPCYAWMLSNMVGFTDDSEPFLTRYATNTAQPARMTQFKLTGRACDPVVNMTARVASFIHAHNPGVRFSQLVVDFIKDDDDVWWMTQVKAFRLTEASLSILSNPGNHDRGEEEDTAPSSARHSSRPAAADYHRMIKCKSCLAQYLPSELSYEMSLQMILETANHLKKRGLSLSWLSRPEYTTLSDRDLLSLYQTYLVCKQCYDLFLVEAQLMELEQSFAQAVGVPVPTAQGKDASPKRNRRASSASRVSSSGTRSVSQGSTRGNRSVSVSGRFSTGARSLRTKATTKSKTSAASRPSSASSTRGLLSILSREVSASESVAPARARPVTARRSVRMSSLTSSFQSKVQRQATAASQTGGPIKPMPKDWKWTHPLDKPVLIRSGGAARVCPPQLTVYTIMVFMHELYDIPDIPAKFGVSHFWLEYTLLNTPVRLSLPRLKAANRVPLRRLRVFYALATPEGMREWIASTEALSVFLVAANREAPLASAKLPYGSLANGYLDNVECMQVFNSKHLGMASIKATIGIAPGRSLETARLRLTPHGPLFLPPSSWFLPAPLPDEWISLIPALNEGEDGRSTGSRGSSARKSMGSASKSGKGRSVMSEAWQDAVSRSGGGRVIGDDGQFEPADAMSNPAMRAAAKAKDRERSAREAQIGVATDPNKDVVGLARAGPLPTGAEQAAAGESATERVVAPEPPLPSGPGPVRALRVAIHGLSLNPESLGLSPTAPRALSVRFSAFEHTFRTRTVMPSFSDREEDMDSDTASYSWDYSGQVYVRASLAALSSWLNDYGQLPLFIVSKTDGGAIGKMYVDMESLAVTGTIEGAFPVIPVEMDADTLDEDSLDPSRLSYVSMSLHMGVYGDGTLTSGGFHVESTVPGHPDISILGTPRAPLSFRR